MEERNQKGRDCIAERNKIRKEKYKLLGNEVLGGERWFCCWGIH